MKLDELEGGKAVLQRILDAYGFTMQKQLGDLHELSSGTISTWVRRNFSPGMLLLHALWTLGCLYVGWQQGRGTSLMQTILMAK